MSSDSRVTNSVLKTQEKNISGSELEFNPNATQSSRSDDMLTDLMAPKEITRSGAMLSWPPTIVAMIKYADLFV